MRTPYALCSALLLLSGCSAIHKALFEKNVAELPVKSIELRTVPGLTYCPGSAVPLIVVATLEDGKQELTTGAGDGSLSWDGFQVALQGLGPAAEGYAMIPTDPRRILFEPAQVTVSVRNNPALQATLPVNGSLACPFVADFSGQSGRAGDKGKNGTDGVDGKSENSSGSHAKAGGSGSSGAHGGNGRNGEAGRQGDVVSVEVTLASVSTPERPLLEVRAFSNVSQERHMFLVDPAGGQVVIRANGGNGGRGGHGGSGGDGGKGGTGAPHGDGGNGGHGGEGGDGADGGDGGQIRLSYDPAVEPFLSVVTLENRGGKGGKGGEPGSGGSGGTTFSGGTAGRAGDNGTVTGREGRPGRDGAPPEYVLKPVSASALSPAVVQ